MLPFSFAEYRDAYIELQEHPEKRKLVPYCNLYEVYDRYIKESGFSQTIKLGDDNSLIYDYLLNTVYLNTIQNAILSSFKRHLNIIVFII